MISGYSRRVVMAAVLVLTTGLAQACTLWAANGTAVEGGGSLLVKNRDWAPDHRQSLRLLKPRSGHAWVGLYAEGNADEGLKAGINDAGLTVVSASANVPRKLRNALSERHGVLIRLLQGYDSVAAVEADAAAIFSQARPTFIMLADRQALLLVEVDLDGRMSVRRMHDEVATHTNHYLDSALDGFSKWPVGASSRVRLARIRTLLEQTPPPYRAEQFAAMSLDESGLPDQRLWRSGEGLRTVTLASWRVRLPADGAPELDLLLANPNEARDRVRLVLDAAFWLRPQSRLTP